MKHLLIIDPQNDFCSRDGALYVNGAENDMKRLSDYIINNYKSIDNITVSLDTHQLLDIAHPTWWENSEGYNPDPFTIISVEDVENEVWFSPRHKNYSKNYVKSLAEKGKYPLCIWPPHCIVGTKGHNINEDVMYALNYWSHKKLTDVKYLFKGTEVKTESYSVFSPEVPTNESESFWQYVEDLILPSDEVIVAGEASSHCVKSSIEDLIEYSEYSCNNNWPSRITLLTDCMSPVDTLPVFKEEADSFLNKVKNLGGKLITSTDVT